MEEKERTLDELIRGTVARHADAHAHAEGEEEEVETFSDAPAFDPGAAAAAADRRDARAVADYVLDMSDAFVHDMAARYLTPMDLSRFYASDPQFSRNPDFHRAFRAAWMLLSQRDWRNPFTGRPYVNMAQYGPSTHWPLTAAAWSAHARLGVLSWFNFWQTYSSRQTFVNFPSLPRLGYGIGEVDPILMPYSDFYHTETSGANMLPSIIRPRVADGLSRATAMFATSRSARFTGHAHAWDDFYVVARFEMVESDYPLVLPTMTADRLLTLGDELFAPLQARRIFVKTRVQSPAVKLVPAPAAEQEAWRHTLVDMKARLFAAYPPDLVDVASLGMYYLVRTDGPPVPLSDLAACVYSSAMTGTMLCLYSSRVDAVEWPYLAKLPPANVFDDHPSLGASATDRGLARATDDQRAALYHAVVRGLSLDDIASAPVMDLMQSLDDNNGVRRYVQLRARAHPPT